MPPEVKKHSNPPFQAQSSILIIGAGAFGLSTAHALLTNPLYENTTITILDAYVLPPSSSTSSATSDSPLTSTPPLPHITASLDSSRIIRADYPKPAYAELAGEARERWRKGWPWDDGEVGSGQESAEKQGASNAKERMPKKRIVYHQPGLILVSSHPEHGAGNASGAAYVRESLTNMRKLEGEEEENEDEDEDEGGPGGNLEVGNQPAQNPKSNKRIRALISASQLADAFQGPFAPHSENMSCNLPGVGYLNPYAGWANATTAMYGFRSLVSALSKARNVRWIHGRASRLLFSRSSSSDKDLVLTGVQLADSGEEIKAEVTILAAGAWSAELLPESLGRRIRASGQVLAYVRVEGDEERRRYAGRPTVLDLGGGMFAIMPPDNGIEEDEDLIKIARHGWGYEHRVRVKNAEAEARGKEEAEDVDVFLPAPDFETLPREADVACRDFLKAALPELADRPWTGTRICWYTDTLTGDFLVDWVPTYGRSLLVATGGSGHGFKFAPVIGEKIVERLEGRLGGELAELWKWMGEGEVVGAWERESGDGSRGGRKGMVWEEEIRKSGLK